MAADTNHPRVKIELGPPEGGWFREGLAHIKLPFIAAFWRQRTWWLLNRSVVIVRRRRNPAWTILLVFALWILTLILVAWGIRGIVVLTLFRDKGWPWGPFNPDHACTGNASTACGAVNGILMPVLLLASSTLLFLAWRLWRVRRFYTRAAKNEPTRLVQTAGSLMDEVVGRDQLSDALMNNLRDRKARRPHVIVGGVGVGKTAVLVHLTSRLAAKGAVPVPIRLRDVQTEEQLDFGELARKRFAEIVQPVVQSSAELDRIWRWLRQKSDRIVVLADGLEEALADPELAGERDNIIRKAFRTADEEELPIVVASRPHDPLRAMQAAITELEPLSDEAALDYISRGGSWRSDPMLLDRVVEAAKMVEAPLYLQVARDLHRKDLLEPLWTEAVSDEPALQDRWAFREDLLSAWLDALVEGKVHPELPIDQPTRETVVAFISALACIGLARDSSTVSIGDLDPSFGTYSDGRFGKQPDSRKWEWKAKWDDRVARYLGQQMLNLQKSLSGSSDPSSSASDAQPTGISRAGQGDFWMDVRVATTWGMRMGLIQEAGSTPGEPCGTQDPGTGQGPGGRVHFQHSIIQAYLGSRFLPGVLEPETTEPASAAWIEQTNQLVHNGLLNSGRELRIALTLHSRSFYGRCTCSDSSPGKGNPCPVAFVREQLITASLDLLKEAEARTKRLFRLDPEMPSGQPGPEPRGSLRRSALEFLGTAAEVDSVDAHPHLEEIIEAIRVGWPKFGLGEDLVRLRETKLAVVEQCAAAARRGATDKNMQPAYGGLFKIACMEPDHRVRMAIARQIGIGAEQAYRPLSDDLRRPENIVQGNSGGQQIMSSAKESQAGASWGLRERHSWQRIQQKEQAQSERGYVGSEVDEENGNWFKAVMQAWLLPMLVESADMTGHKGSPWNDLEELINDVTGVNKPSRGAKDGDETPLYDGTNYTRGLVLAQGFKYAANRRLTPWSNQEAREFLIKKAEELLKRSAFWYTRLTLVQALTLWALPDDVSAPQRIRGHGADPNGKVHEWLRMGPGHEEHPLVTEAAKLGVRALQTRRPERFLWIDDASVVSQIGTEAGAPGEPRLHNLWIPPSTGWSSLDFKAQQLLADVLLLLVLGERDSRPKDLFRLLERVIRTQPKLPSCLSRDRTRLDPVRAVESGVQPGDYCRDDCEVRMCPYPVKAKNLRVEFNELFCLHQRAMLKTWQPQSWLYLHFRREAPWQRQVPVTGMRRFWDEMGERAGDTIRPR
jgi:NACHT domain